jgi:hypothetical protein
MTTNDVKLSVVKAPELDPFDPAALRIDQSFLDAPGAKKLLRTVPVGKPKRQDFVRVHPSSEYCLSPMAIIKLEEDREYYLVTPDIAADLPGEIALVTLYTAINRQGIVRLWPVKLPAPDGKVMDWHRTEGEAAELAKTRWVRIVANMQLGSNDIFEANGSLTDPVWPNHTFRELLQVAFSTRMVNSHDHPVIGRLMGEV